MEFMKIREKSKLLKGLTYLDKRSTLNEADKKLLTNLEKGFEGESSFDKMLKEQREAEIIVLNDLLLMNRGVSFQIDSLIISSDTIYINEIKNYKGSYILNSDDFTTLKGTDIPNPKIQLVKIKRNVAALLQDWNSNYKIEANVIFVHPNFTLYQAQVDDPFIFPSQIGKFLAEMSDDSNQLTKQQYYLANKFLRLHQEDVPYQKQMPSYQYQSLKKGLSCIECDTFNLEIKRQYCTCRNCLKRYTVKDVILNSIEEFNFLFPSIPLTTNIVYEWCGEVGHIVRIRSILKQNFTSVGTTNGTYYH
ncbi:nuclease-related domain-containing protein [Marinilactibacillus piezotolerans]|uniref:nuclease-related domain-containing protein n=1 Tax=Marinilactibacillus piezotolerans TaxID=258723 RepID=UPI0009B1030E|nr:nuclease-related domain-containing protein [Marinilactibacillus piezotolerans]